MISKSKKWGLSTYITLILVISIIGKRVGIRLFFCRNSYTFQKFTMDHILFPTYHMIQEYISGKVHIK